MVLKFYNTLTRKKEDFVPLKEREVGIYTCGPTVYDFAHIGNFRAYVFEDVLRRYLKYRGYKVTQVMNITDVDDKTIKNSREKGIPLAEYTKRYEEAFFEDLKALNIEEAERYPRATEHISEMVEMIKRLMDKGLAYVGEDDSIYFAISRFKDYGKLSGLESIKGLKKGARVRQDEYGKEDPRDFALWKAWDFADGDVYWLTDIGKGRPGWHIECSAMSTKYLGETFDIHAGGVDLIFPHHENEIAQSEGATGKPFVRYWLHNEHLLVEGQKMSKSLGNFYTLRDLLDKGHEPAAIRYLLLSSHYRQKLNFTFKRLRDAERTVERLRDFMARLQEIETNAPWNQELYEKTEATVRKFEGRMDDDLDTPRALAAVFELVGATNRAIEDGTASRENLDEIHKTFMNFDQVLGILQGKKEELPEELAALIKEREEARKRKDFATADRIRAELKEKGILLEDGPEGTRWKRV